LKIFNALLMKTLLFFILFSITMQGQNFGDTLVHINPLPKDLRDMEYYKWYSHPEENNIFIKNFQTNLHGFMLAFSETHQLLSENDLHISQPAMDSSLFHHDIKEFSNQEELHQSISENKSKIIRTWNVDSHYLSLVMRKDVYMLILGNKRGD